MVNASTSCPGLSLSSDIGLASSNVRINTGSANYDESADVTIGTMVGGGYALPIGTGTRILIGLYVRPLPKLQFSSGGTLEGTVTNLTVGFLF